MVETKPYNGAYTTVNNGSVGKRAVFGITNNNNVSIDHRYSSPRAPVNIERVNQLKLGRIKNTTIIKREHTL